MKTYIFIFITLLFIGCNSNRSSGNYSTHNEIDSAMLQEQKDEKTEMQIIGVGLKNNGSESVTFYEIGNHKQVLDPGQTKDFMVSSSPTIIMVEGQTDQWQVEKQKRYQFVFDLGQRKWDIEEVP